MTKNSQGGAGVGTAFVYSVPNGDGRHALFLVSNKHVVDGSVTGDLHFTQTGSDGQPDLNNKFVLTVTEFPAAWRGHPEPSVDVTVAPLVPLLEHLQTHGVAPYFKSIGEALAPTVAMLDDLDAIEECVFVGYPNDIWDSVHNLPVVRRGLTATHPSVDFRGMPAFLLDASVFPGSSGSPVLLYNRGAFPTAKSGAMTVGTRVAFLGLIASVFFRESEGRLEALPIPTTHSSARSRRR